MASYRQRRVRAIFRGALKSVGTDSPLGVVLEWAQLDDIVTFTLRDEDIRVQVVELINA